MNCYVPAESAPAEPRAALTPATAQILVKLGITVQAAPGLGRASHYSDEDYIKAGVILVSDHAAALASADLVLRVRKPPVADVARMQRGALHLSFLDPFNEKELLAAFAAAGVSAVSLEMIPRTTQAQKMDALSSQASLAGYSAVIEAAQRLRMALPMMMTPAGTIISARVFIIGAGVAGLQAIATAKRLGAKVSAYDVRPASADEVKSMGATFVTLDLEALEGSGGYAREMTEDRADRQRDLLAPFVAAADVLITTAAVPGRQAPLLVTRAMVEGMKPGSVVVDLASETGGNVEGSMPGEEIKFGEVLVWGAKDVASEMAVHASQLYSMNIMALLTLTVNEGAVVVDPEDEVLAGCAVVIDGVVRNQAALDALGGGS